MSVGFSFENAACKKETAFAVLKKMADNLAMQCAVNDNSVCVSFCHMGVLYFNCEDGLLSCECQTNIAGPGFHKAAVDFTEEFLRKAGLSAHIDDEAEYAIHHDFERMRREHFHNWLNKIVRLIEDNYVESGKYENLMICWDLNQYTPQNVSGAVVMPIGRFSGEKLVARVESEGIEPFARDFFIWYEEEKDAYFYRNQALLRLWEDCYFKPSARSGEDELVNSYIRRNIEAAANLSSEIPLPLREYRLLCEIDEIPVSPLKNPELQTDYPIGYRRGMVTRKLGNLKITLPGSFLLDTEDGSVTLYDGEDENWHVVRLTAFGCDEPPEFSGKMPIDAMSTPEEFTAGDGRGKMAYAGLDEDGWHHVFAQILSGMQLTLITISFDNGDNGKEWAYSFLRGLKADVGN